MRSKSPPSPLFGCEANDQRESSGGLLGQEGCQSLVVARRGDVGIYASSSAEDGFLLQGLQEMDIMGDILYCNHHDMVTTTTAIQVDVTPQLLKKSLGSLIGLHACGRLIFLPVTQEDDAQDNHWSSKKGVPAEEFLAYLRSIDG